jgi:hypothetical protein
MSKQLMFYDNAVPINSQRHKGWSVAKTNDFAFARHANSVPLMAVEFSSAMAEYAIVFAGAEAVLPVVILGIHDAENLYLNEALGWNAKYIPAFVRRYPFVFSSSTNGHNTLTLCIDEEYFGCNQDGRGERLFDSQGQRTMYLESMLQFVKQYQEHSLRTQAFCNKLKELNLLDPMQADFTLNNGEKHRLTGFMAVNRDRLKGLSGEQLVELVKNDGLELIYLHLQSMRNLGTLAARVGARTLGGEAESAVV